MLSRRELLLAAGALGLAGCKGAQQVDVAVTGKVEIRPVADDDPWVAALGLVIQPAGADGPIAEVERGSTPQGETTWTFRAKTPRHLREAIEGVVTAGDAKPQPEHLELVFEALIDRESGDLHTAYFVTREQGLALDSGTRAAYLEDGPMPVILLKMTEADGERFAALTDEYLGKRLAMIVDGVCLSAPAVHEKIDGGEVQLTSGPPSAKKALRQQFEALTT